MKGLHVKLPRWKDLIRVLSQSSYFVDNCLGIVNGYRFGNPSLFNLHCPPVMFHTLARLPQQFYKMIGAPIIIERFPPTFHISLDVQYGCFDPTVVPWLHTFLPLHSSTQFRWIVTEFVRNKGCTQPPIPARTHTHTPTHTHTMFAYA